MHKLFFAVFVLFALPAAYALEVAGVRFDDQTRVGQSDVIVNGAGMRKMAIFKVYAMALYLPEKQGEAGAALSIKGAKRVAISLLRDVTAQQFVDGLQEGIADNQSEAEMATLRDRVKVFSAAMLGIGEAKTGTRVFIDWFPDSGTRLTVNGQVIGTDIAGEDFYKAILKIWLGSKPVQGDLKQALLGKLS
jgi:hypothetical protein